MLKFIVLVACCAGGFFLPEEETFLEGKERTLNSRAAVLKYFVKLAFVLDFATKHIINISSILVAKKL